MRRTNIGRRVGAAIATAGAVAATTFGSSTPAAAAFSGGEPAVRICNQSDFSTDVWVNHRHVSTKRGKGCAFAYMAPQKGEWGLIDLFVAGGDGRSIGQYYHFLNGTYTIYTARDGNYRFSYE